MCKLVLWLISEKVTTSSLHFLNWKRDKSKLVQSELLRPFSARQKVGEPSGTFFCQSVSVSKNGFQVFLCLLDLSWPSSSSFASVATWVEIGRARAWARGPEPKSLTHLKWRKGLTKLKARSFFLDWPKTGLESSSIVKSKLFKLMLSSDYNLGKPQFVLVRSGKRFYWYRLKIIIRLDVQMLFFGSNCQHPDSNLWRLGWESPITTRFQLTCKMQASAKK